MKYRIYSIIAFVVFALVGCVETEELDNIIDTKDKVLLSVKTTTGVVTRAEDTSYEERIDWLDVFFFNDDFTVYHKERIDVSSAPVYKSGEFSISKKRSEFEENEGYYIYIVANASTNLVSDEAGIESWEDLLALEQRDYDIHYSAFIDVDGDQAFPGAPERFLMDGFVYVDGSREPANMPECVINDTDVDEISLCGTLYRAAAKFIINIKEGESVEFQKELFGKKPQYYINQLPVSTKVLPLAADEIYHPTTQNTQTTDINPYTFLWNDKDRSMTIVGYGYADDWSKLEYTKQTSMVFNLPMFWDKDKDVPGMETESPDNWYKIPLSKDKKFERNTCYIINIIVNAVGAEEREWALELKDIEYITLPWQEVRMDIGDYNAAFLTLNTDLVKIYDSNIDENQLTFTSSSPIKSIILKDSFGHDERNGYFEAGVSDGLDAYYIDKFGQKIQLGTDPGFDLKDVDHPEWTKAEILAKELKLYADGIEPEEQYIRAVVWDEHKRALNGNITIHSPILAVEGNEDLDWNSHFNTVRYLEFEVENEQGITAIFRVEQTPLTVISNMEGYFSYRDDYRIGDAPVYHNPDSFTESYDKIAPVDKGPLHLLNPGDPFFMTAGFLPYHEHECTEDGVLSYVCPPQKGFEELLYGGIGRVYHRSYSFGGPIEGTFHRDHYIAQDGRHLGGNNINVPTKYYQAVGPVYTVETTNSNGETSVKYYRRHYTGNFFETFWSKYVHKVYTEDGENSEGKKRKKGQADIVRQEGNETRDGWHIFTGYGYSFPSKYVNHRMYHVRVTSTSDEYIIANPQMMDENGNPTDNRERGFTMEGDINSRIVSPSFMVASQLGESSLPRNEYHYVVPGLEGIYYYAKRQCQEYVEARYEDLNDNHEYDPGEPVYHYHDWRLPTKAEVEYIVKHQEISRAMDKVLYAQQYFHASVESDLYNEDTLLSDEIPGYDTSHKGYYMRCVRDAYIEPEPIYYDANYNIVKVGK